MTPEETLDQLRSLGVSLTAQDDRLTLDAPKGTVTAELLERVRSQKTALVSLLRESDTPRLTETHGETHAIPPLSNTPPEDPPKCYSCKQSDWWTHIHGGRVCRVCHPPPSPDLVADAVPRLAESDAVSLQTVPGRSSGCAPTKPAGQEK